MTENNEQCRKAFDKRWGDAMAQPHIKALCWDYFSDGWNSRQVVKETQELMVLQEIRSIIEPVPGKLMQNELVEEIRKLKIRCNQALSVEKIEDKLWVYSTEMSPNENGEGFVNVVRCTNYRNVAKAIHAAMKGKANE